MYDRKAELFAWDGFGLVTDALHVVTCHAVHFRTLSRRTFEYLLYLCLFVYEII